MSEFVDHEQACDLCGITVVRGIMKKVVVDNQSRYVCDLCCFELDKCDDIEVDATKQAASNA